ncbi:MAG: 2-hydroxyacyl-CoA dehydratase family protein [Proteobacteria bacterium]|nr:2-hydroxyacyl-CoA dehydratase family protein [Pseudomonadota bacterium]
MNIADNSLIGFACAYTPLPLIAAAGFTPYRVLPMTETPDQTGRLLHDNLCPHVKSVLDRVLGGDIPPLTGMVFMNSCDAMRRLYDAWRTIPGGVPAVLIDLPVAADDSAVAFFAAELKRLAHTLEAWGGETLTPERIRQGVEEYNTLGTLLKALTDRVDSGTLMDGPVRLQTAFNRAATSPFVETAAHIRGLLAEPVNGGAPDAVPLYLFGNVLPDPEAFRLFAACGARIAASDLCSGTRLFQKIEFGAGEDPYAGLAGAVLGQGPCARTFDPSRPIRIAEDVLDQARAAGARGVICHTVKFCDPYLARLAAIRRTLQEAGMPFLVLEGDCTLRSVGQQRTRIEAFVEMLR